MSKQAGCSSVELLVLFMKSCIPENTNADPPRWMLDPRAGLHFLTRLTEPGHDPEPLELNVQLFIHF